MLATGEPPAGAGLRSPLPQAPYVVRVTAPASMTEDARRVQRVYLTLLLGNTLAASFIWGINTLFLFVVAAAVVL